MVPGKLFHRAKLAFGIYEKSRNGDTTRLHFLEGSQDGNPIPHEREGFLLAKAAKELSRPDFTFYSMVAQPAFAAGSGRGMTVGPKFIRAA